MSDKEKIIGRPRDAADAHLVDFTGKILPRPFRIPPAGIADREVSQLAVERRGQCSPADLVRHGVHGAHPRPIEFEIVRDRFFARIGYRHVEPIVGVDGMRSGERNGRQRATADGISRERDE